MEQKSLEFIAHQLSKITTNLKYNFGDEYYVESSDILHQSRDLHFFFDDADRYLELCDLPDLEHKEFILTFSSPELRNMAIPILKSHDYLWDEEFDDVDNCKLYIHSYDKTVYDFIFSKSRSRFSINQLSIILNTKIDFEYSYPDLWSNPSKLKFGKCTADSGAVEFDCVLSFKELNTIEDIYEFNKSLYIFTDLVNDIKIAKAINLIIAKE